MKVLFRVFGFIRSNITSFSVVFLLLLVCLSNTILSDYNFQKGNMLFGYLDEQGFLYEEDGSVVVKNKVALNGYDFLETNNNLLKIANADTSIWGNIKNIQEDTEEAQTISTGSTDKVDFSPMLVQANSLVAPATFYDSDYTEERYGIIKYSVVNGDTPSSIATSFGISTYTLLWANDLKVGNYIKPGQTLDILPITGVKHTVAENDTIESIAEKYKADKEEIIVFNELPADGTLTADKVLIIPNGEKEKPVEATPTNTYNSGTVVSSSKYSYSTTAPKGHVFPYGQCTWYVATRTYVPWGGNAKEWLVNSRAYGFTTGSTPVPGAIVVTTEHRIYGHVAYVESVTPTTITISEMNYTGWARKSVRVLPRNSYVIRGYIYPKD